MNMQHGRAEGGGRVRVVQKGITVSWQGQSNNVVDRGGHLVVFGGWQGWGHTEPGSGAGKVTVGGQGPGAAAGRRLWQASQ